MRPQMVRQALVHQTGSNLRVVPLACGFSGRSRTRPLERIPCVGSLPSSQIYSAKESLFMVYSLKLANWLNRQEIRPESRGAPGDTPFPKCFHLRHSCKLSNADCICANQQCGRRSFHDVEHDLRKHCLISFTDAGRDCPGLAAHVRESAPRSTDENPPFFLVFCVFLKSFLKTDVYNQTSATNTRCMARKGT